MGIGDNAVGDAALLELARVFHKNRAELALGLKVAWWPGHSTGRYGGSTWYADNFGLDLARNCIAQVDIDSPGCRAGPPLRRLVDDRNPLSRLLPNFSRQAGNEKKNEIMAILPGRRWLLC